MHISCHLEGFFRSTVLKPKGIICTYGHNCYIYTFVMSFFECMSISSISTKYNLFFRSILRIFDQIGIMSCSHSRFLGTIRSPRISCSSMSCLTSTDMESENIYFLIPIQFIDFFSLKVFESFFSIKCGDTFYLIGLFMGDSTKTLYIEMIKMCM